MMKSTLLLAFSALSFFANAQNAEKLKPFAHKLLYVDKANIYSGVDLAKDGEKYSTLTIPELISGFDATWIDPNPRKSLLDKSNGLSHNRSAPIFKKPVGDIPHIFIPNVLATQFISKKFEALKSPNTTAVLVRLRDAVKWEGGIGLGIQLRDRDDHFEIGNFNGAVHLDKGLIPLNRWVFIVMEDNGDKSRMLVNGVQIGGFKTLPKSYIDAIYYGTNSHVIEHDFGFGLIYNGIYTESQLAKLMQVVNKIVPIGSFPRKPVIYEPKVKFENGVFKLASYKYHGYDETPINPASIRYEWIVIDGETGLDGQRLAGTGAELSIPKKPGQQVAVIVTCKDMKGRYYSGIPFRSEFFRDERP